MTRFSAGFTVGLILGATAMVKVATWALEDQREELDAQRHR